MADVNPTRAALRALIEIVGDRTRSPDHRIRAADLILRHAGSRTDPLREPAVDTDEDDGNAEEETDHGE